MSDRSASVLAGYLRSASRSAARQVNKTERFMVALTPNEMNTIADLLGSDG